MALSAHTLPVQYWACTGISSDCFSEPKTLEILRRPLRRATEPCHAAVPTEVTPLPPEASVALTVMVVGAVVLVPKVNEGPVAPLRLALPRMKLESLTVALLNVPEAPVAVRVTDLACGSVVVDDLS